MKRTATAIGRLKARRQTVDGPVLRARQAVVISVDSTSTLTVDLGGTQIPGVAYFDFTAPQVGAPIWLLSFSGALLALGHQAP